jgi:hypothetical protein
MLCYQECCYLSVHSRKARLTLGGLKYGPANIEAFKKLAPLKDATDMADCADAYVMIAKNGI